MCIFCGYETSKDNYDTYKNISDNFKKYNLNISEPLLKDNYTFFNADYFEVTNKPMKIINNDNEYIITYTGNLYNQDEIKDILKQEGYITKTNTDDELILLLYICYKENLLKYLNGAFSFGIFNTHTNEVFIARDHLGIKPLYYTNNKVFPFMFSSSLKPILANSKIKRILDKNGIKELFALGPAHSPGKTYFKDIFEIEPGHYAIYKNNNLTTYKYWDLKTHKIDDNEETIIKNIHDMLVDCTKRNLNTDKKICTMLSGGIDSSILTKIANDYIKNLKTFSIDFEGNEKNFVANSYQSSRDNKYIDIMKDYLKTDHTYITLNNTYLFDLLKKSTIARDMPGMADIDASMYAFCSSIAQNGYKVCISGECSDEILGGYPWYYKNHLKQAFYDNNFPWALSKKLRSNIVKSTILTQDEINDYIKKSIDENLKNVEIVSENENENYFKKVNYLTVKYFMNTLIERTDRTSQMAGLEVRIPYANYKFFEYIYNVLAFYKLGKSYNEDTTVEKYLLRKAFLNEIPDEVLFRKKSPFPKTYDKEYLRLVENKMLEILNDKNSKINKIIDTNFVLNMINMHGENIVENWFGQLMTYPQTLAYLIQIEIWLKTYDIEILI